MSSVIYTHHVSARPATSHMQSPCHRSSRYVTPPIVHTPRTLVATPSVVHASILGSSRLRSSTPFGLSRHWSYTHTTPPVIYTPHTPVITPSVVHAATLGSSRLRSFALFGLSRHWSCMVVITPVMHVTRSLRMMRSASNQMPPPDLFG